VTCRFLWENPLIPTLPTLKPTNQPTCRIFMYVHCVSTGIDLINNVRYQKCQFILIRFIRIISRIYSFAQSVVIQLKHFIPTQLSNNLVPNRSFIKIPHPGSDPSCGAPEGPSSILLRDSNRSFTPFGFMKATDLINDR
jgi:hypothetical protein